jgi:uncharacterized protein YndB with AHSA1/START domain
MSPVPSGKLRRRDDGGRDLVLTRTFRAGIDDVWASITESERTARWFASWTGDAGPGKVVRMTLEFEEGRPESDLRIDACDPPHHLAVSAVDEHGSWKLEARLHEDDGVTTLTFVHHLDDQADPGMVGPGWEYYLDMLVASRDVGAPPAFDDYFPSQQPYYEGLAPE